MSSHNSPLVQMLQALGGGISGGMTRFLTHPFDVLKIRFQLQVEPLEKRSIISKYSGMLDAFSVIYREEGLRGIWKGHISAQTMSITYALVQFWSYEQLRRAASQYSFFQRHPNFSYFMCGGMAGCIGTLAAHPFDVVRTRVVAADPGSDAGKLSALSGVKNVFQREGLRGVSSGLMLTLLQIYPLVGANFVFYKFFNHMEGKLIGQYHHDPHPQHLIPGALLFFNAAVSGVLAKIIVYPLDLIKKRSMLSHFEADRKTFGVNPSCNTIMFCIRNTIEREGVMGLYKGMVPTLYKSGTMSAFYFTIYDYFNHYITIPIHEREVERERNRSK
ncbi:mitochondrial thiamine pyrophosphate carrier [Drosophila grimshawi]|uniref:GH21976 n=1 Tax=Drosophila grimshawi TaxID=7222 RepID=B4J8W9_DROGR|nr:mitochondrial thiamine pyrophosphate carrier [Drosophila grimshawi]EDW02409.1 GH21976 [Drosophila grimshawi]